MLARVEELEKDEVEHNQERSSGYPFNDMLREVDKPYIDTRRDKMNDNIEYKSLGQQLKDVFEAGRSGIISDRLQRAATGLSESVPSDGGFLIQQQYGKNLLENAWDSAVLAPLCYRVRIGSNSNSVKIFGFDETSRVDGSRFGGALSYWLSEAAEKQASKPKFRQIELSLNKLVGLCYATDEVLADAGLLEQAIRRAFTEEISFRIDDAILNGTGAGMPLGVIPSASTVTISKEAGQTASTIVFENCLKMWARLLPKSQKSAIWAVHPTVYPSLYAMSLSIGTSGQPVFMPAGGASEQPYASLFGRPVIPCEQCQQLGTAGDIVLGDFKNGYVLADKGGIQEDVSIHVRFIFDESVFRFVLKTDGQPVLASAITPFNSTDTMGHFCVIEDRT